MKNYFLISLSIIILAFACKKLPNDGIPSYIKLSNPSISVEASQGAAVHSLSDLWVQTEGLNLGAYEYPTVIAAYIAGDKRVVINPGIIYNGVAGERRIHPAFQAFEADLTFVQNDTLEINPVFKYRENVNFLYIEDFENTNNFDEMTRTDLGDIENQVGKAGVITLSASETFKRVTSISPFEIAEGARVYLEFSLKTQNYGGFGFRSVIDNTNSIQLGTFQPFDEWTTTYFNLTNFINVVKEGEYEFYIDAERGDLTGDSKTYIDNFKILQF